MERPVRVGEILLGKYRVERMLGRGGMGYVLAVRHVELDELFALKLLSHEALRNPDAVARFVQEARVAARLKSEHVARVIDVGHFEDGAVYIIMEHLHGHDLGEELRQRGPLPVEEAITYVLQACDALSEVHAEGFVHRDIKPGNLFLTRRPNGRPCVKVLDFGIAKHLEPAGPDLTQSGIMLGSPRYMSPEQMRRTRSVDARSDVWSMGVVLFKLLTNTLPFQGESVPEIISSVLFDEPLSPSSVRADLPVDLDSFLALALEKEPEHRFQTIDEFAFALTLLRDDAWDRPNDSGVEGAPSSRSGEAGVTSAPVSHRSWFRESYVPAIPAASVSQAPGAPAPVSTLPAPRDSGALLEPTAAQGRGRGAKPPASLSPGDMTPTRSSAQGSTRAPKIEANPVANDDTRIASASTIGAPPHARERAMSFVTAVAVLGVIALGSAWVAHSCAGVPTSGSVALAGASARASSASSAPPAPPSEPSASASPTGPIGPAAATTSPPAASVVASSTPAAPVTAPPPSAKAPAPRPRPDRRPANTPPVVLRDER